MKQNWIVRAERVDRMQTRVSEIPLSRRQDLLSNRELEASYQYVTRDLPVNVWRIGRRTSQNKNEIEHIELNIAVSDDFKDLLGEMSNFYGHELASLPTIAELEQHLAAKEEQIKQLAELVEEREKISINARYSSHMVDEVWKKSYIKRQLDQILKGDNG